MKNPLTNAGDTGDAGPVPWSGRSSREGNSYPLQYSCLENSMDREAWWPTVHGGHKELNITEQLSVHARTHTQQYNAIELKVQHTCSRDTVNSTRPSHVPVSFLNLLLPWNHHSSEGHQKPRHHPAFPPLLPALLRPLRH